MDAKDRERELKRFETLYRESQDALEIARAKSLEAQMKYAEASANGQARNLGRTRTLEGALRGRQARAAQAHR